LLGTVLRLLGVYLLYERWLSHTVKKGPMPEHVAVILDGNRRWARSKGWPIRLGHQAGADKVEEFLKQAFELGIETITLYALSTENLKRSPEEVAELFQLIKERAEKLATGQEIHRNMVRVNVIGRKQALPPDVRGALARLEASTNTYSKHYLNIAIAYGGRAEIVDAVRAISEKVKLGLLSSDSIDEETVDRHLYTSVIPHPNPELIIRTSGRERISNFLLWQSAYSEFVFQDVYWPSFRRIDLLRAIRTFQQRERTLGV